MSTINIHTQENHALCKVPGCNESATFQPYDFAPNVRFCDRHAVKLIVATIRGILPESQNHQEGDNL